MPVHQVWNIHNNLSAVYHQCPRVIIYKSKASNTRRCLRRRGEMVCVLRLARFRNGSMHGNCHDGNAIRNICFCKRNSELLSNRPHSKPTDRKQLRYCCQHTKTKLRCAFNQPWKRYFGFSVIKSPLHVATSFIIYLVKANAQKGKHITLQWNVKNHDAWLRRKKIRCDVRCACKFIYSMDRNSWVMSSCETSSAKELRHSRCQVWPCRHISWHVKRRRKSWSHNHEP